MTPETDEPRPGRAVNDDDLEAIPGALELAARRAGIPVPRAQWEADQERLAAERARRRALPQFEVYCVGGLPRKGKPPKKRHPRELVESLPLVDGEFSGSETSMTQINSGGRFGLERYPCKVCPSYVESTDTNMRRVVAECLAQGNRDVALSVINVLLKKWSEEGDTPE